MLSQRIDGSKAFWTLMLPVGWGMAFILSFIAHAQTRIGFGLSDKVLQTLVLMAIFSALIGLMAVRVLMDDAILERRPVRAIAVGLCSLFCSVGLIAYGVSTLS